MVNILFELGGLLLSLACLGAYVWLVRRRLRNDPMATVQAVNRTIRTHWTRYILEQDGRALLGVQTLRNSTMAATFFASTAVLLMIGSLNLMDQAERLAPSWQLLHRFNFAEPALWPLKVLVLVADFFVAFFSFAMSVRWLNHVGYQISLPREARTPELDADRIAAHLNHGWWYYTVGMRAYYLSVPLVFSLFGPMFMLAATVVIVTFMSRLDHASRD